MIYLIHGENYFLAQTELKKIIADKNIIRFEGKLIQWKAIASEVSNRSLFETERVVVIKDFMTSKPKIDLVKEAMLFVSKAHENDLYIFLESQKADPRIELVDWITSHGKAIYAASPAPLQLKKTIQDTFSENAISIENDALDFITEQYKNDSWGLQGILKQLKAYAAETKKIEKKDLDNFISVTQDNNIFELGDYIGQKNTAEALKVLNNLLNGGAYPGYLVTMIARQMRLLIETKVLSQSGIKAIEIQKRLKLPPSIIAKTTRESGNFSLEELQSAYESLIIGDWEVKTGKRQPTLALELWISSVCGKR